MAGPLTSSSSLPTAEILAIGSELLTPFRSDTNSLFVTRRLNDCGIEVVGKSVVADSPATLEAALRLALSRAAVVVTTGGLGPTDDDLTRDAIATVAGVALQEQPAVVETIRQRFERRGLAMPAINRRQAQVPVGAEVLDNPNGTAPGLWVPVDGRVVIALPGPPRELMPMWEREVAPRLADLAGGVSLRRRVIKIAGRGESHVDERAAPIYREWSTAAVPVATSILASPGQVELHLSARGVDVALLDAVLEDAVAQLVTALGRPVFSTDGRDLEEVVGAMLASSQSTIAVAESCTAGLMLGRLTQVPGSSAWVRGGVVAYDNAVKTDILGVPADAIEREGAVSETVATAMAGGVRGRLQSSIGVGITGIAGPGGGSAAKPVGTVVIAVDGPGDSTSVRTLLLPGDRTTVRRMAVQSALEMVRRALGA